MVVIRFILLFTNLLFIPHNYGATCYARHDYRDIAVNQMDKTLCPPTLLQSLRKTQMNEINNIDGMLDEGKGCEGKYSRGGTE